MSEFYPLLNFIQKKIKFNESIIKKIYLINKKKYIYVIEGFSPFFKHKF